MVLVGKFQVARVRIAVLKCGDGERVAIEAEAEAEGGAT